MTYKLYTDGSYFEHFKIGGIGGYLLDDHDNKIWKFSEKLQSEDHTFLIKHEIHALEYGLKKCIANGVKDIKCFLDSKDTAEILNIKDMEHLRHYLEREPALNNVVQLLSQFNNINFYYLPREENKEADLLSRKSLVKDFVGRNQIIDGAFQLPNLFSTQQFSSKEKQEFANLKRDVNNHYFFNLIESASGFTVDVYEMEKFPEIKILSTHQYKLGNTNCHSNYLALIAKVLEQSPHDEIGLIIFPTMKVVDKIIRGTQPIGKKNKSAILKLAEIAPKFSKIVVHHDDAFVNAIFPTKVENTLKNNNLNNEGVIIENLRILCDPNYKLGSNMKVEKFFEISEQKLGDIKEIQKKYLGELIKLKIAEEKINQRLNNEVIVKEKQEDAKYKALSRIEEIRRKLEHKGIKLSI
jgi:ribonuclease HI